MKIPLLLVFLVLSASACTSWQRAPLPWPAPGGSLVLDSAVITARGYPTELQKRRTMTLYDVQVRDDSVFGWGEVLGEREDVALHRDQVLALKLEQVDPWRTLGAAVLAAMTAAAYVVDRTY